MAKRQSHFGGVAARVLRDALRRSTVLTGMTVVSCLFLGAKGLAELEWARLFPATALVLVSFGLAFHAVRAAAENGLIFKPTLGRVMVVGSRTAIASALWFVPWTLWGASVGSTPVLLETSGAPSPLATGLYIFGCLIATPALLISAVYSRGWLDVLSVTHWSRQFRGRSDDLMTVYTIQTGGLVLAVGLSLPFVVVTLHYNATVGLALAGAAACLVLGYWVRLTGLLCGAMHAVAPPAPHAGERVPRFGLAIAGSALDPVLNRDLPELPLEETSQVETAGEPQPQDAIEVSIELSAPAPEAPRIRRYAAPSKSVAFEAPKPLPRERCTPLLDGEARVQDAMKRFRLDPSHTLSRLTELNQNFAPNPHVLQALAVCLHRTGHPEQALKTARQAFPLCFERGQVSLAAALFYEFRGKLHKLDLKQDQVLAVAEVLHKADELAAAAKAYSLVIHADPTEFGAIKGLIDVADRILKHKDKPAAALKVYVFLLEHCADAAMTEIVRDRISRCRDIEGAVQPLATTEA